MAKYFILFMAIFIQNYCFFAQSSEDVFELKNNYASRFSSYEIESGLGLDYIPESQVLHIKIGASPDFFEVKYADWKFIASPFFLARARAINYKQYRLQIDCADGHFGGILHAVKNFENFTLNMQFRALHWSAHFVDGNYDLAMGKWITRNPLPYARDYGEIFVGANHYYRSLKLNFFLYSGLSNSILKRPAVLKKYIFHAGLETNYFANCFLFERIISFFFAAHFSTKNYENGKNNLQIISGIKLFTEANKSFDLYVKYSDGNSYFGQLFDYIVSDLMFGFRFNF